MKYFLHPNQLKIKIMFAMIAYIFVGTIFISSFNCARCKETPVLNILQKTGIVVAYPALILSTPCFFIMDNLFTIERTNRSLMIESGMVNGPSYPDPMIDVPIKSSTSTGLVAGIFGEIIFIYLLSCLVSLLYEKICRQKSVQIKH